MPGMTDFNRILWSRRLEMKFYNEVRSGIINTTVLSFFIITIRNSELFSQNFYDSLSIIHENMMNNNQIEKSWFDGLFSEFHIRHLDYIQKLLSEHKFDH